MMSSSYLQNFMKIELLLKELWIFKVGFLDQILAFWGFENSSKPDHFWDSLSFSPKKIDVKDHYKEIFIWHYNSISTRWAPQALQSL